MTTQRIGVIMHGATGRIGMAQHLVRSILAIRAQGGVALRNGTRLMPNPILVGRDAGKLERLAREHGGLRVTTDLDKALADPKDEVFFDAGLTLGRPELLRRAIAAGKHVYSEKPVSTTLAEALSLYEAAKRAGIKHGVVQDALWFSGLRKIKMLVDTGFFGRILSVRGEFGYWVFEGDWQPAQRPSWNYRKEDGGGLIVDTFCRWRYILDHLFGDVKAVSCLGATHLPERWDETGKKYKATADDAAYATFQLAGGAIVQFNCSWCVRVRRDDVLTLHVDGTHGSAVAGLRRCLTQGRANTPKPVWNPDVAQAIDFYAGWQEVPDNLVSDNPFKTQWELFLKHVAGEEEFRWNFLEGAKGVQLSELALESWAKRRWVEVPALG